MDFPVAEEIDYEDLSDQQISDIREAFSLLEDITTQTVPTARLELLLRLLGLNPNAEFLQDTLNQLDPNKEGKLRFDQVLSASIKAYRVEPTYEDLMNLAKSFDADGDGFLTVAEVKRLLMNSGELLSRYDIEDIIDQSGVDVDNRIRIKDFVETAYNY
ncbi:hypothetical protein M8J76_011040 [Diaphorina citri]|nr:hypothetical protein M8J75_015579 [Diaphorina citri]KAI5749875.1 hypothetical protein M8J76_011040 [Diaphorina citri]